MARQDARTHPIARFPWQRPQHAPSYYAATAIGAPDCPTLAGAVEADVCVVGAGYTGVSTALNLAERGYSVVVLEAARIGWGASGRNGGQICSGYSPSMRKIAGWVGVEDAKRLWDMAEEAKAIIRERVARHDIPCDLKPGYLLGAAKPHGHGRTEGRDRSAARAPRLRRCAPGRAGDEIRSMVATDIYHGGLYDAGGGHLHPLNYNLGLARAAIEAGAEDLRGLAASSASISGSQARRHIRRRAPSARAISCCAATPIWAIWCRASAARSCPSAPTSRRPSPWATTARGALIPSDAAVSDTKFVLDYYRLTADHRLLFGGRVSYTTLPPANLNAGHAAHHAVGLPQT